MQSRTTPFIIGAVIVILAIVGGFFLFGGGEDSEPDSTAVMETETIDPRESSASAMREEVVADSSRAFAAPALSQVYFDYDRYAIRSDARGSLSANVAWLKENTGASVVGCAFLIALDALGGEARIAPHEAFSLVHYE